MLKFVALFLGLFSCAASAQTISHPQTWINDLVHSPSLIEQVRFPRGGGGGGINTNFKGSPLVTISSITPSIATSRDTNGGTAQTPYFIQVSAKNTTAVGTSAPYQDLWCSWNFGDPSGTETFTRPTDGATVNANTDQNSCEAAYVYRAAGPYTITLTVYGSTGTCNSVGLCQTISASTTKPISVAAFTPTGGAGGANDLYFDPTASCPCAGTSASPYNTLAPGNTLLNSGTTNIRLNFARGTTFSVTSGLELFSIHDTNGVRIGAYGAGAKPIIKVTAGATNPPINLGSGNGSPIVTVQDIVVQNMTFINEGLDNGNSAQVGNRRNSTTAGGNQYNIYWDNNTYQTTMDTSSAFAGVFGSGGSSEVGGVFLEEGFGWGQWKCDFLNSTTSSKIAIGKTGSAAKWDFVVGGQFVGAGTDRTRDHHYYPDTQENFLVQWVTFGATGTSGTKVRSFALNGNWDGQNGNYNDHQVPRWHVVAENSFLGFAAGGVDHTVDLGNRTNNTPLSNITASISGTTLNVTAFTFQLNFLTAPVSGASGSSLISDFAGGTLINGTRIVGSSTVSPGLCTPNCTGAGTTGTYAVDTSQTVASQAMIAADSTVQFDDVVIERNAENGFVSGSMAWGAARSVTIRDHRVWGGGFEWYRPAINQFPGYTEYQNLVTKIYRNHIYMADSAGVNSSCVICFDYSKTWTSPQYVAYNTIADARTVTTIYSPNFEAFGWADFIAISGAQWDYNTWSAPSPSATSWADGATGGKSFANWKAAGSSPARWGANDTNLGSALPAGWANPPAAWADMN